MCSQAELWEAQNKLGTKPNGKAPSGQFDCHEVKSVVARIGGTIQMDNVEKERFKRRYCFENMAPPVNFAALF